MSYELTGYIKSEKYIEKYGMYIYSIKNKKNDVVEDFTYFSEEGLNTLYEVTIKYNIKDTEEKRYKTIKTIEYGNPIKDNTKIEDLLLRKIQLTKTFTNKIIEAYGEDTLKIILETPEELKKIKHRNIGKELEKINTFTKDQKGFKMSIYLTENGIGTKYHKSIISYYNGEIEELKGEIYEICSSCKVPFGICDKMALMNGYNKSDPKRIETFIYHIYKESNNKGKLYLSYLEIDEKCKNSGLQKIINTKEVIEKLVKIGEYYTSKKMYEIEKTIEKTCEYLIKKPPIIKSNYEYDPEDIDERYKKDDPSQMKALEMVLKNSISIINGGAGTGKTYTIGNVVEEILNVKNKEALIYILAPTGAAIERIKTNEKIANKRVNVRTIHSFLYLNKENEGPESLGKLINKYDELIICIDEMSMVDMKLFYKLIETINEYIEKTKLVILGDYNQLPSIRGGNLLSDMYKSGKIKVETLKNNHRQRIGNKLNGIYHNSQNILNGKDLVFDEKECIYVENTYKYTFENLKEVIKKYGISYENTCVITPKKKVGICVNIINQKLQKIYNKNEKNISPKHNLKVGDKVMQNVNNKKKDVYNGSIMMIEGVIPPTEKTPIEIVKCRYYSDDNNMEEINRKARYTMKMYEMKELDEIELAYSFTIHKSQGKGYDNVIIIIDASMKIMLNKKILYTAITRAKKRCIIIGSNEALELCKQEMTERITGLFK